MVLAALTLANIAKNKNRLLIQCFSVALSVIFLLVYAKCNFATVLFIIIIVPTFITKVTDNLCSGWVSFSSEKFHVLFSRF